jgi:CspA family cold shock protein
MKGTEKWSNEKKVYGCFERDDGEDVFVYFSAIVGDRFRSLQERKAFQFDVEQGRKGSQARNVKAG